MMNKMYLVAGVGLLGVVAYFGYHFLSGGINLINTYAEYRSGSAYTDALYPYILILFFMSTIYLSASGPIKRRKIGWGIWALISVYFALNGNKGEFMYALLAVMGLFGSMGKKVSTRLMIAIAAILFLVIPSITLLRSIGIVNNLSEARVSFISAFTEMGMQIRTTVLTLE